MSTNRSVGRLTAAQDKDRLTATRGKDRSTATQAKVRSAVQPKNARSTNLCVFTFADGRQCRTPRCSGHLHLCYFHAQKEAESLAAQQVGQDISRFLPAKLLTACDLAATMSRLFCAAAQGQVKRKLAGTLAYLAQTMLQSIPIAQHEYCEALGTDYWRGAIRSSFNITAPEPKPAQSASPSASQPQPHKTPLQPAPQSPATPAGCHSERSEGPLPKPPQPAPSPHTPLPPTTTEFAQQVIAGRNSSLPGREPGPSDPSSAPSSDSARAQASCAQPAPPAPPPVPPGFGAPANWDALIPPRPRRRFSRHWQSHE